MKIFVTGVAGQLGHDVMNELAKRGLHGIGSDIAPTYVGINDDTPVMRMPYVPLDITDAEAVRATLHEQSPDAVIHCAAYTAVDDAEEKTNIPKVRAINAGGTANIAACCKEIGAKLMYISTDYIFNGQGQEPWAEDCQDFAPLNVYGQTKLEGELAVRSAMECFFIVRIAWAFGLNGKNFIKTILNMGKRFDTVRVVNDQIGTPTYTLDLARLLVDMILTDKYGYYHATNEGGYISWYDVTCEIFRQAGYTTKVVPVTTMEYGLSKAKRPFNSRLCKEKLQQNGFTPLPDWRDAVGRYLLALEKERKQEMNPIIERRSIRKYTDKAVNQADIEKILQAGIYAPSAKNRQPWKYIVFTGEAKSCLLDKMEKGLQRERDGKMLLPASHKELPDAFHTLSVMREAPVLILIENTNGNSPYQPIDSGDRITEICDTLSIGASVQNMLLTATVLGYGTLWIANTCFAYNELVHYAGITGQLVGAVALGYANEHPTQRPRKPLGDVVEFRSGA